MDSVCNYFNSPEVMRQIEVGVLQTLPSAIIISMVTTIWSKMKKLRNKKNAILDEENSWMRIERNIRKIDKEFSNHDYILSDDMERIFEASREEIQPLLKLCGCKCFLNKNYIWNASCHIGKLFLYEDMVVRNMSYAKIFYRLARLLLLCRFMNKNFNHKIFF